MKTLRRLVPVSVMTAFAALCVWGLVTVAQTTVVVAPTSAVGRLAAAATGSAVPVSATAQQCPRTGCTASSCHGAVGAPPPRVADRGASGTTPVRAGLHEVEFEIDD
jgi:hypothetical protein